MIRIDLCSTDSIRSLNINDDEKGNEFYKIEESQKTFKGERQFIILVSKKKFFGGIKWKPICDKYCFERNIPLYFNETCFAVEYILRLEN